MERHDDRDKTRGTDLITRVALNERVILPALSRTFVQRHPTATANAKAPRATKTHTKEAFQPRRHVQRIALAALRCYSSFSSYLGVGLFCRPKSRFPRTHLSFFFSLSLCFFFLRSVCCLLVSSAHLTRSVHGGRSRRRWSFSGVRSHLRKCRLCPRSGNGKAKERVGKRKTR